jgi:hypothetical protein
LLICSGIAAQKFAKYQSIRASQSQPGESRQDDATGHNPNRRLAALSIDNSRLAFQKTNCLYALHPPRVPAKLAQAGGQPQSNQQYAGRHGQWQTHEQNKANENGRACREHDDLA